MRQTAKTAIVLGGTALALAAGGGISAFASWETGAKAGSVRTTVSRVPAVSRPKVEKSGNTPKVSWSPPAAAADRPFDGFVVLRHSGSLSQTVCSVAAAKHACTDPKAAAGATVTYVVHATMGASWSGPDSDPSEPFLVPGGPKAKASAEAGTATEISQTADAAPAEAKAEAETSAPAETSTEVARTVPTKAPTTPAEKPSSTPAPTESPTPSDSATKESGTTVLTD
jgi:hypothetical protein